MNKMIIEITVLIVLIMCNALLAAIEMSFITLNDYKIKKEATKGNKKAIEINKMLKSPSKFLATIQIGITFAGFLSSAFAATTFADRLSPYLYEILPILNENTWNAIAVVTITIILSGLMLVFGELVPKRIAMKHDEKVAYRTIGILKFISIIFSPFVYILTKLTNLVSKLFGVNEHDQEIATEEEVKILIDECHENGTLQKYEQKYIHNILEFNDVEIAKIMTKKDDMFIINSDYSFEKTTKIFKDKKLAYSKLPVYDKATNKIIGIIHSKDILRNIDKEGVDLQTIMRKPVFIPQNKLIYEAFNKLKRNKSQIGIIIDENNDYIGMITIEDILEEIVGNIYDEFDK